MWTNFNIFSTIYLGDIMDCIFCKIIAGEIPSYKVYEDDLVLAFLDINPYNPGHTLIIPKKHTLDIYSIDNEVLMHIMNKARDIAKLVTEKLGADGFTLIQNNGITQEVKHYHLHVVPAYSNKKSHEFNKIKEHISDPKEVYEKIKEA